MCLARALTPALAPCTPAWGCCYTQATAADPLTLTSVQRAVRNALVASAAVMGLKLDPPALARCLSITLVGWDASGRMCTASELLTSPRGSRLATLRVSLRDILPPGAPGDTKGAAAPLGAITYADTFAWVRGRATPVGRLHGVRHGFVLCAEWQGT
jgi:hypothetical protein